MKSFFLAFVALTLAVDATIAIECYTCGYLEGAPSEITDKFEQSELYDKSCKSGKKPSSKLKNKCGTGDDLCGKIVVEGDDVTGTLRGCFASTYFALLNGTGLTAEECYEKTGKDLIDLIAKIPGSDLNVTIPINSAVTMCTCKDDKCNSSSMLKVTQASLMVLVIGFFTSKFMY